MKVAQECSPLQWMEMHLNTLYCFDAAGRMRCVNEIGEPPPPLFCLGRTTQGNIWRVHSALPAAIEAKLDALCRMEPVVSDLAQPPQNEEAIRATLDEFAPRAQRTEYSGPAYRFPEVIPETIPVALPVNNQGASDANVVQITPTNAALLQPHFAWMVPLLSEKELGPVVAMVEQDCAVTLCFCSRRPGVATEAGLETVPALRGKGYATATVAAWAAAVRAVGCVPLYSTSWENLASRRVAQKLALRAYGAEWSIAVAQ